MIKKLIAALFGLALFAIVAFVSCSRSPVDEHVNYAGEWNGLKAASMPYARATLKILGEDLPPLHSLDKLKEKFTTETDIRLDIDFKNHSKVIQSILVGSLSNEYQYDIVFVPHKETGKLVSTRSVFPLSRFATGRLRNPEFKPTEQFFQPFWEEVTSFKEEWYAMPLYLGGSIVVYRKDLLESAEEKARFAKQYDGAILEEPRTIDDWVRLAEFFYRPDQEPPLYGITLLLSEESLWYEWQSVLFALGGNVLDTKHGWEYGDIVLNSPQGVEAVEYYLKFARFCPPDAASASWGQGIAKLQAGATFMTLLQYDVVAEFENPEKTKLAGKFGYFLPRGKDGRKASQLESWVGFIPVSSKHPEAAWLLLQWMMGPEVQLQMHLEGNVSPRKSTYEDPRVRTMNPTRAILESLSCMTPKPTIPEADAIQDIITRKLQSALKGELAPKVALEKAAVEIEERLKGRARLRFPPTE